MKRKALFIALVIISLMISSGFGGCKRNEKQFYIGVLQWTENIEPFNKTFEGVMDGLKDRGYREGVNLELTYGNAGQNKESALKIAQGFVRKDVDLIVALGTGSSMAALKATEKKQIPIVFSIVGAPKATSIIESYADSGRNITGVSMKVAVKEQFRMIKECFGHVKKLGVIYCTKMPQAVATGKEAIEAAPVFGWTPLEVSLSEKELYRLKDLVQSLAREVDLVYVPTDPILDKPGNLQRIIAVCDEYNIPVAVLAERSVEQGGLVSFNCDFYRIGLQAATQISKVLTGMPVRGIPVEKPVTKNLYINLKKARELDIEIKRNCILKADKIFD